jgi:hypothetical protein
VTQKRRLTVALPEAVWDALYAEGGRTYERPAIIAERVLTESLAEYVAVQLRRDLTGPTAIDLQPAGSDATAPLTSTAATTPSDDTNAGSDAVG